ncbi:MAG: hypothetical protein HY672_01750 [Chloroflexi bacterium]|nr:hypothetical protein [Chloroflexota bacterium]
MSIVVAGLWIAVTLLAAILMMAYTLFSTSMAQGDAFRNASRVTMERVRTRISVANINNSLDGEGTSVTVYANNTGETLISRPSQMDILVRYTQADGSLDIKRLAYADSCPPTGDEWCIDGWSPDSFNPSLWDPGEQATLDLKLTPSMLCQSPATVVIVAPNGITALGNFTSSQQCPP